MADSLTDLVGDEKFQALSPDARRIVIDRIAPQDQGFGALSPEAQNVVKLRLMGGTASASPAAPQGPPTFRQQFATGMQALKAPLVQGAAALSQASFPSQDPRVSQMFGQAVGSPIPETPEGVAVAALPFIPKIGPALTGTFPRAALTLPAVGGGTAALTGGDLGDIAQGTVLGGLSALGVGAARGTQRGIRSARAGASAAALANEQMAAADSFVRGLQTDLVNKGVLTAEEAGQVFGGKTGAEKLIQSTQPDRMQAVLSKKFQEVEQRIVETVGPDQVMQLPQLGLARALRKVQSGVTDVGDFGLSAKQDKFTAQEALDELRFLAQGKFRGQAKNQMEALGVNPQRLDFAADQEFRQALIGGGYTKEAGDFAGMSGAYRTGQTALRTIRQMKQEGVVSGGGPEAGGLNTDKLPAFMIANQDKLRFYGTDFPETYKSVFPTSLGQRSVTVPSGGGYERLYGHIPGMPGGISIPLGPAGGAYRFTPGGAPMQPSLLPAQAGALGGTMGGEALLQHLFGQPRQEPSP